MTPNARTSAPHPRAPHAHVVISPGLNARALGTPKHAKKTAPRLRLRAVTVIGCLCLAFCAVGAQLLRLANQNQSYEQASISRPLATAYARPDLVDRNGRLLAGDLVMPSLFADPQLILDRDEAAEKLSRIVPELEADWLRSALADRSKRFVWLKRGISPATARAIHNLGLPGLSFQYELKRAYPAGRIAGHLLGFVNVDNLGLAGLERYLDDQDLTTPVHTPELSKRKPVRLSLDLGVQHALEDELADGIERYNAEAASGIIIDVRTGEVMAAASLPGVDPLQPLEAQQPARADRLMAGAFELGSVFKMFTIALALEQAGVTPDMKIDVTRPLVADGHTIADPHPSSRPLSVSEVFTKSSNVGAGVLALAAGADAQKAFLDRIGFANAVTLEAGRSVAARMPERWGAIETVTVSYGHGLAVSPLQFAVAAIPLVNGGLKVEPTLLRRNVSAWQSGTRVLSEGTSSAMAQMMRANVATRAGTGWRADVPGYRVGGKTGTAEIAINGRYDPDSVITSFIAAFPMDAPRFLTLTTLYRPKPVKETDMQISAGRNAAPLTGRLIARIAPQLGVEVK